MTPWPRQCRKQPLPHGGDSAAKTPGRVDLRADKKGLPHFLEINPLAGLHPDHSDLPIICKLAGITYHELITMIMESRENASRILILFAQP